MNENKEMIRLGGGNPDDALQGRNGGNRRPPEKNGAPPAGRD